MAGPEKKLRQMEEEMNRFEAEIAHQDVLPISSAPPFTNAPVVNAPIVAAAPPNQLIGGFTFAATPAFVPHQLRVPSQHTYSELPVPPGMQMYNMPLAHNPMTAYHHQQQPVRTGPIPMRHKTVVTDAILPRIPAAVPVQKVISAAPQMAGPTELAARFQEAETASKSQASVRDDAGDADDNDDDDDVTRALLAAAAGVTYSRVQGHNGKNKVVANITKPPLTPVIQQIQQQPPQKRQSEPQQKKEQAIASQTDRPVSFMPTPEETLKTINTSLPPPPPYRAINTSAPPPPPPEQTYKKKKKYLRTAAGIIWEDPTLTEWDPNDFRIFCGDLGNEVSDDTLTRAFNRYTSFQKARIVRDKRTGKSRGYGFVSFSDPADFTRAMREMNGKYVGNRPIKLKRSDWRNRQVETHRKKDKERKKLGMKN